MASALSKNNLRFQTSYRPENTPKLTQKRGAPPPLGSNQAAFRK